VVHNKRTYQAQVIGTDPSTDLALLKVEASNLPAVKVISAATVSVGDWVLAVGNPFNLTSTVTAGIVSAKGRDIGVLKGQFPLESFIQTDAAINPGNSGGALVNLKGELVGINTAILSQTGSYSGYGFAVPSDIVAKVYNDLKQFGQVQKAFLGVQVSDVNEENYKKLELAEITGVFIASIEGDGAAARAGLKQNDVILKINNKNITSKASFDEQISYYKPSDKITLQVSREGKIIEKTLELTNIDGTTSVIKREVYKAESLGAEFELIHKGERSRLGIESGVRIAKINEGFLAQIGMEEGFIVTSVNNVTVDSPQKLAYLLENTRGRVIVRGINKQGVASYYSYSF
jgi:S1-C subfamily serine protease